MLEVQKHIEEDPAAKAIFTNARDELIPNPAVYTDWFERSPEHDQKRVVGARRMNMLRSLLPNEKITWGHFVDPDTGRLLDEQELYRETPEKRRKRLERFTKLISRRRELTRQVANYGYLPPKPPLSSVPTTPALAPKPPVPAAPKPAPITVKTAQAHFVFSPGEALPFIDKKAEKGTPPLRRYLGKEHTAINEALRTGKNTPATRKLARGIDRAMKKLAKEIPVGTVLYRAAASITPPLDKGFMSTSLSLGIAREFGGLDAR